MSLSFYPTVADLRVGDEVLVEPYSDVQVQARFAERGGRAARRVVAVAAHLPEQRQVTFADGARCTLPSAAVVDLAPPF